MVEGIFERSRCACSSACHYYGVTKVALIKTDYVSYFALFEVRQKNKAWDCETDRETGYGCQLCQSICQDIFSLTHNLQFSAVVVRQADLGSDATIFG